MAELNRSERASSDHRIRVSTPTRVRTDDGERPVTVVALSARSALVVAAEPLGAVGRTLELMLPGMGGAELEITAGIARIDRVHEGAAVVVQFMIGDPALRRAHQRAVGAACSPATAAARAAIRASSTTCACASAATPRRSDGSRSCRCRARRCASACAWPPTTRSSCACRSCARARRVRVVGRVDRRSARRSTAACTPASPSTTSTTRTRTELSELLADIMCR